MIYGSVCSGIEAATVAWHPLDWKPAFFAEIEKHPCSVLKHHYPDVPNLGDMTKFKEWPDYAIDLLIGGTPCQSFSVAGLRKGLADPRGNLALTYLAIADRFRPEWCIWENVPGVLSSGEGRDFGAFLGGLAELGYGSAYRVLDAQFIRVESHPFAVPQRRRRVIVVAHLGDWRRAAAVLFERESLSGNPPPRRQAGQIVAPTISARPTGGGGLGTDFDLDGGLIAKSLSGRPHSAHREDAETFVPEIVSQAMSSKWSKGSSGPAGDEVANLVAHTLRAEHDATEDGTGRGTPLVPVVAFDSKRNASDSAVEGVSPTLRAMGADQSHANSGGQVAVSFMENVRGELRTSQITDAMTKGGGKPGQGYPAVMQEMAVRRLTPVECCRLQGFPDDYLDCLKSDGPKYKALGNSMAVNCIRWLGDRIEMVSKL